MYEQKLIDLEEKLKEEKLKKNNEMAAAGGPAFLRREVTTLKQQVVYITSHDITLYHTNRSHSLSQKQSEITSTSTRKIVIKCSTVTIHPGLP